MALRSWFWLAENPGFGADKPSSSTSGGGDITRFDSTGEMVASDSSDGTVVAHERKAERCVRHCPQSSIQICPGRSQRMGASTLVTQINPCAAHWRSVLIWNPVRLPTRGLFIVAIDEPPWFKTS